MDNLRKSLQINLRLSGEDRRLIEALREQSGQGMSRIILDAVRDTAKNRGLCMVDSVQEPAKENN